MSLGQIVWELNVLLIALVVLKLFLLGLNGTYRWLVLYLAIDAVESGLNLVVPRVSTLYGVIYVAGQSLKLLVGVGVVLELFYLALESHPALASYGRKRAGYLLLASAIVSLAGISLTVQTSSNHSRRLLYEFFLFERLMGGILAVFLLLISILMSWFPVRVRRNVALCIYGFLAHFSTRFVGLLAIAIVPLSWKSHLDTALLAAASLCLLIWLIAINRAGEKTKTVIGQRWNPSEAHRLALQMDAINASLVRFVR